MGVMLKEDDRFMVFDIETDGLKLEEITTIHTIGIFDSKTEEVETYNLNSVKEAVELLEEADVIIGHNIIDYDIPVINKFYDVDLQNRIIDTLVYSRVVWADIYPIDGKLVNSGRIDKSMMGKYSLEAFGQRLGVQKGDFHEDTDWQQWSPEMDEYCAQDVRVTLKLLRKLGSKNHSKEAIELEHKVMKIIKRQIDNGINFDVDGAQNLYAKLKEDEQKLKEKLQEAFPMWIEPKDPLDDPFVPKRDNSRYGYVEGAPCIRIEYKEFNPNSRQQIAKKLKEKYDWEPQVFTPTGQPKVSESILDDLDYPEAELLSEYMTISKRLGQIGDGPSAWLKLEEDGKIYGYVNTNGTVTGRMTHSSPNMAQVPANDAPYGEECRELFQPRDGWKMVGCDASGLELRCLAHYMAKYDGGEYAKELLEGDIHTKNQKAAGLETRPKAKRFIYAF